MHGSVFSRALRDLEMTLAEIRTTLLFVRSAAHVRPRLGSLVTWTSLDEESRLILRDYMEHKDFQPDFTYRGLYVLIYGTFEEFVRRMLRDAVIAKSNAVQSYDDLDQDLARQNVHRTGQALATIDEPPSYMKLNYDLLCANIGTCRVGSTSFTLNADAFALFFTNLSPKQLAGALRRIGIKLNWDEIGQQKCIKKLYGSQSTRAVAKAASEQLQAFTRKRNLVAHSGGAVTVSDVDVAEALDFVEKLANALAMIVDGSLPH